jgi:hypothetical protein
MEMLQCSNKTPNDFLCSLLIFYRLRGTTMSLSFVSSESLSQLYIFIVVAMYIACICTQRLKTLNNVQYTYDLIQSTFLHHIMPYFYLASATRAADSFKRSYD